MTTKEILKKARKLISKKSAWTQGDFARSKTGKGVGSRARSAVSFCAFGAVCKVSANGPGVYEAVHALDAAVPGITRCIVQYNDAKRRTHEQILKVFDRAIAAAP